MTAHHALAKEEKFNLVVDSTRVVFTKNIAENCLLYAPSQTAGSKKFGISIKLLKSSNLQDYQLIWPRFSTKITEFGEKISYYSERLEIPVIFTAQDSSKPVNVEFEINYVECGKLCQIKSDKVTATIPPLSEQNNSWLNLLYIIPMALIGGFILNFMPCVLPVLSLKLISLAKYRSVNPQKSVLAIICGILSFFLILGLIAISFKATGEHFNLGFNFQRPTFIISLLLIITILLCFTEDNASLNLPNWFYNFLHRIRFSRQFVESYFTGLTAAILSTPCTAPFLGSALLMSFQGNNVSIIICFCSIGAGFALPYILLLIYPQIINFIPKSGKWMLKLKFILSFMLVLTIFWLLSILKELANLRSAVILFLMLILLRYTVVSKNWLFSSKIRKFIIITSLVSGSFFLPEQIYRENNAIKLEEDNIWQSFAAEEIPKLIKQDKIVIVDVTADWCVTCKYNKYMVFEHSKTISLLANSRIIAMRADITNHDPKIQTFLQNRQISGIPYTVIFSKTHPEGIELPVILSYSKLKRALNLALE